MEVIYITEDNFKNVPYSMLTDPKWYPQVEEMMVSIDAAFTPEYSKEYAVLLRQKLEPVIDTMPPDLAEKYLRAFKVLRLQSLLTVKDETKAKFFQDGILDCFRAPYTNVRLWVELVFLSNSNARDIMESYRKLAVGALRENIEVLGKAEISMLGNTAPKPSILKNWLADYELFVKSLPTHPPTAGRIEEGQYLTASKNAQTLDPGDKDILLKVLELFDWLRFSKMDYDFSLPGSKAAPEEPVEEKEHVLIPRELADAINQFRDQKFHPPPPAPKMTALSEAGRSSAPQNRPSVLPRVISQTPFTQSERTAPARRGEPFAPPAQPRILSQTVRAEIRPATDLLKPEAAKLRPAPVSPSAPPPSPEAQRAALVSGSKLFTSSLSHAIANADLSDLPEQGKIRAGSQIPSLVKSPPAPPAAGAGVAQSERAGLSPNARPVASSLPPNLPLASGKTYSEPGAFGVIDLSRRQPVSIISITTPEGLAKIELADIGGQNFDGKLAEIKQKIKDLAREYQMPVSGVAGNFYRSPLYQLFTAIGVAVMNDNTASDQKAAFEKVVGTYRQANKPALTREQFLSLSRFKKELVSTESRV